MNPTNPVQLSPNLKPGAQPDPSHPEFGPWGPNPTQNWVQIGYIEYIIGLNPKLKPI